MSMIRKVKHEKDFDPNEVANQLRKKANKAARNGYIDCRKPGDSFTFDDFYSYDVERMLDRLYRSNNEKFNKLFYVEDRLLNENEYEKKRYAVGMKRFTFYLKSVEVNENYGVEDNHLRGTIKDEVWLMSVFLLQSGMNHIAFAKHAGIKMTTFRNKFSNYKFTDEDMESIHLAFYSIKKMYDGFLSKLEGMYLSRDKYSKKRIDALIESRNSGKNVLKALAAISRERMDDLKKSEWIGVEGYDDEGNKLPSQEPEIKNPDFTLE